MAVVTPVLLQVVVRLAAYSNQQVQIGMSVFGREQTEESA